MPSSPRDPLLEMAEVLYNRPLLMSRPSIDRILAAPLGRSEGVKPEAFHFLFREESGQDYELNDGVAVIDVHRYVLRPFTYQRIRARMEAALASRSVRGILLDIDSPGGSVAGVFDLMDWIHAQRGDKPIWAIANDDAFSAAYAIASAADRVHLTRTGGVGSIGVIAVHVEFSRMDEREGVTYTPVFSGDRKNDYADTEPLNDTARQLLQGEVDRLRDLFAEGVARNRGLSAEQVLGTEAGLFHGPNGVTAQLGDEVASFDETLGSLQEFIARSERRQGAGAAASRNTGGQAMADDSTQDQTETQEPTTDAESASGTGGEGRTEGAEVVSLDAARAAGRKEGTEAFKSRVAAINTHCRLAGCPDRAGEFIESDLSAEGVGTKLLEERANDAGPEVSGTHAGSGEDPEATIDTTAVYQRWNDPSAFAGKQAG